MTRNSEVHLNEIPMAGSGGHAREAASTVPLRCFHLIRVEPSLPGDDIACSIQGVLISCFANGFVVAIGAETKVVPETIWRARPWNLMAICRWVRGSQAGFEWRLPTTVPLLAWARTWFSHIEPGAAHEGQLGRSIVDLFCDAGAISATFCNRSRQHILTFAQQLDRDYAAPAYGLRWLGRDLRGALCAHIALLWFGAELWQCPDGAARHIADSVPEKNFVADWFVLCHVLLGQLHPRPLLFVTWTTGHAYWQPFVRHLQTSGARFVHAFERLVYFRMPDSVPRGENIQNISFTPMGSDRSLLRAPDLAFRSESARRLADSLATFDAANPRQNHIGSPFPERLFVHCHMTVDAAHYEFVALVNNYPASASLLLTAQVGWVFPVCPEDPPEVCLEALTGRLAMFARQIEMQAQGMFYVGADLGISGTKTSDSYLLDLEALRFWGDPARYQLPTRSE